MAQPASQNWGIFGGRSINDSMSRVPGFYGGYGTQSVSQQAAPTSQPGKPMGTDHSILRTGDLSSGVCSDGAKRVPLWELVLVPWLLQALVLGVFLLAGDWGEMAAIWACPSLLLLLCLWALRHNMQLGNTGEVVIVLFCIVAICLGTVIGAYGRSAWLMDYHRISQGASYFNVLPSELAAGKADATTLDFTQDAAVDGSHVYGFVDANSQFPKMYCVAPISSPDSLKVGYVQYWAAGINCCSARSSFSCGDASNGDAHGAFVLPKGAQLDSGYQMALAGASAAYGIPLANQLLLVQWQYKPMEYVQKLFRNSLMLYGIFSGVYLMICFMVGIALRGDLKSSGTRRY